MNNIQIFAKILLEQIEVARVRQLSGLKESANVKHSDTAKAISLFQKYTKLDRTGIPDPKTMNMIKMVAEGKVNEWNLFSPSSWFNGRAYGDGTSRDDVRAQDAKQNFQSGQTKGTQGGATSALVQNRAELAPGTTASEEEGGVTYGVDANGQRTYKLDPTSQKWTKMDTPAAPSTASPDREVLGTPAAPPAPATSPNDDVNARLQQWATGTPEYKKISTFQGQPDEFKGMQAEPNPNAGLTPDDPRWTGLKPPAPAPAPAPAPPAPAPAPPAPAAPEPAPAVPAVPALTKANPPTKGIASSATAASEVPYTVQKGDNLTKIAKSMGTTLPELLKVNPQFQKNPNLILPGQNVNRPGAPAAPAAPSTASPDREVLGTPAAPEPAADSGSKLKEDPELTAMLRIAGLR
jgi:LysM repeat protein